MSMEKRYAWYVAVIWPDAEGVPTAKIFDWGDPRTNNIGPLVATVQFSNDPGDTFEDVIGRLYYEIDDKHRPAVFATGVTIKLRRETSPVTVPATTRATVGA